MTNSTNDISKDISMNGQKEVTTFKYLEETLSKDGGTCSVEIRIKVASAMSAMARFNRIRQRNNHQLREQVSRKSLSSSPSSSVAVRHGPCLLTLRKRFRLSRPNVVSEETSPHLLHGVQDQ